MAERQKLLYVVVQDVETEGHTSAQANASSNRTPPLPRYTRPLLQSTLQLMGCKPRHAFKVSDRVFDVLKSELPPKANKLPRAAQGGLEPEQACGKDLQPPQDKELDVSLTKPHKLSRKRSAVTVSREKFLDVVCTVLEEYQYVGPNQRADLMLACRVRERKTSVTILLCGTSGCGKSTLSSLLASRLGITTVVSTDSVRHMMRSFADENENPLLWASTYHAGDYLDPEAVAEAKAKKKAAKMASLPLHASSSESSLNGKSGLTPTTGSGGSESQFPIVSVELQRYNSEGSNRGKSSSSVHNNGFYENAEVLVGSKTMAVQGFKAQSEMVIDSLDRLITAWEKKCESVVVEGVHLSLNFVMGLMKKHPSVIPFMVYIANEGKHLERFAVRAKYMTLDPARNKYVKYIRNIRTIQEYLCKRADKHLVPKVNNTNVDRSVAAIHATIFSSLRRRDKGEPLFDQTTNTVKVVNQEYRSQYEASALGSKGMFQLIQRQGSSRHLVALMNVDGSVAKAWPIQKGTEYGKPWSNGEDREIGSPVYGPILGQIGKVEPVNLQFGSYGLSAWPNDVGGTSHHGSFDGQSSRGDPDVHSSYHGSSPASSPRGDGADKDLIGDEVSVSGSEEEAEEGFKLDSDMENSDGEAEVAADEEIEGSVDEESIRSDEDAEEFEIEDGDDGYWSEEVEERAENVEKSGPPHVPGRARTDNLPRQMIAPRRSPTVKIHQLSSHTSEESAQGGDLLSKPRGVENLTIAVPPFGARLHARSRSSTVR